MRVVRESVLGVLGARLLARLLIGGGNGMS